MRSSSPPSPPSPPDISLGGPLCAVQAWVSALICLPACLSESPPDVEGRRGARALVGSADAAAPAGPLAGPGAPAGPAARAGPLAARSPAP
eukprot:scaffold34390_cov33-Phaeocystis_antarctica.AAC.1